MEHTNWISVLTELAEKAGEIIKLGFESSKVVHEKSSAMDIVTEFDTKVEDLLIDEIRRRYPEHLILGEEQEYRNKGFGAFLPVEGFVWVIDPIDGTLNFASGIPLLAVSIALFYNGEPIAGIVYNPLIQEMFTAEKGKGATLNNQQIKVKQFESLERSIVGVSVARRKKDIELTKLADRVGGMRALGTAAIALAYVASGRLDAYWEKDLNLWDIAAGMLLIQEAGGIVKLGNYENSYPVKISEIFAGGLEIDEFINVIKE
jgi:myo-inositol-1(or 4)-monophosphatase